MARSVLACWKNREIELIMDQTDLDYRFHLLFVTLPFRKRAIFLLWTLLPKEGCSGATEQKKLLAQVAKLLPPSCKVVVYAAREYGSAELFTFLHKQGWFWVIRMKKHIWCKMACGSAFQIGEIPLGRGNINFEDAVYLKGLGTVRMSLNCGWSRRDPDDEPWYLLTNLLVGKDNFHRYSRRFCIEERFRDFKEQGFRLDKTHLEIGKRIEALGLCVCIAYTWTLLFGVELELADKRREIDRAKKPQLRTYPKWPSTPNPFSQSWEKGNLSR